uniref:Uncharacterized protein n=1 Tax=Meloidogyne enterolobii TaxID=390850 RepID=A0A6V7TZ79_MELEN|nr:unnamed protein product [Meloidogyne enterolobii]
MQSTCRGMQNSMLMSMDKMAADQPPVPVTQEPVNEPSTQKEMAAEQPPVPNTQEPVNEHSTPKEMDYPTTKAPCHEECKDEDCE